MQFIVFKFSILSPSTDLVCKLMSGKNCFSVRSVMSVSEFRPLLHATTTAEWSCLQKQGEPIMSHGYTTKCDCTILPNFLLLSSFQTIQQHWIYEIVSMFSRQAAPSALLVYKYMCMLGK